MTFIPKAQGRPQKATTLRFGEGIVSKNVSKTTPPSPKPNPTNIDPTVIRRVIFAFLSLSSFENSGFLLHNDRLTIRT